MATDRARTRPRTLLKSSSTMAQQLNLVKERVNALIDEKLTPEQQVLAKKYAPFAGAALAALVAIGVVGLSNLIYLFVVLLVGVALSLLRPMPKPSKSAADEPRRFGPTHLRDEYDFIVVGYVGVACALQPTDVSLAAATPQCRRCWLHIGAQAGRRARRFRQAALLCAAHRVGPRRARRQSSRQGPHKLVYACVCACVAAREC